MLALADHQLVWILAQQEGDSSPRAFWFLAIVLILAIQHFVEKAREKREAQELERRRAQGEDDEEEFDFDFELEDGDEADPGYLDPEPPRGKLAEFFRQVAEEQARRMAPAVPVPPVQEKPAPPKPQARPPVAEATKSQEQVLSKAEAEALERLKKGGGSQSKPRHRSSATPTALGQMLRDPASLRNAFILKEILEPPLATREEVLPHEH